MRTFLAMCLILFASACMPSGEFVKPQTTREHLVVTEVIFTGIVNELNIRRLRGDFTETQLANLREYVTAANIALEAAHSLINQGQENNAMSKLILVNEILKTLQTYLESKEAKEINFAEYPKISYRSFEHGYGFECSCN